MSLFRKDRRPDENTSASLYAATVIAAARTLRNRRTDLLTRECERAVELGQSLTLLYLAIRDWEGVAFVLGEKQVAVVVQELEQVLRGTLRVTDIFLQRELGYFTILLPGTLGSDVPTVARNLRQAVRGYRLKAPDGADYFLKLIADVGAASLPEDGTEPEVLRALALQRLQESSHQPDPSGEDDEVGGSPTLRLVA
jgi:GGDEF domain-containing protein